MRTAEEISREIQKAGARCLCGTEKAAVRIGRLKDRLEALAEEIRQTDPLHPWAEAASSLSLEPDGLALMSMLWSLERPGAEGEEAFTLFLEKLGAVRLPFWVVVQKGRIRLSPVLADWLEGRLPALPEGASLQIPKQAYFCGAQSLMEVGGRYLAHAGGEGRPVILCIRGGKGSGRRFYLEQLLAREGLALLLIDGRYFSGSREHLEACMLCGQLYGAVACVCQAEGTETLSNVSRLFYFCTVIAEEGREPDADALVLFQDMPIPDLDCRVRTAEKILGETAALLPGDLSIEQLVRKPLPAGALVRRLEQVRAELSCGCFRPETIHASPFFNALHLLPSARRFEELKLPTAQYEKLRQISRMAAVREEVMEQWGFSEKFSYGNGLSVLFYGAPGTGKTMAAQVLAGALGMPLYQVDLSQLISKYIGETQKNIGRIFDEAEAQGGILLFDEADAVFASRSEVTDAQDRYSNAETAYLLQRIEQYTGISILATNLLHNFDEAFRRRISYMVHFPMPDAALRRELWQDIFPSDTPVSEEIDYDLLARNFELSGAAIRNAAWHGALLARSEGSPVGMHHVIDGIQNEYSKLGKRFPGEGYS